MNLEAIEPIIEQIVKDSLNDKVYIYGKRGSSLTNRVATGNLRNSIKATTGPNRDGIMIIQLTAFGQPLTNTYAYWLIYGRKGGGNFANIGSIQDWIMNKKSFKIRDFKTGKFLPKNEKNVKNAAYVIARSIGKFGFKNKPKNFIEVSFDKILNNKQIIDLIEKSTMEDLLQLIENI